MRPGANLFRHVEAGFVRLELRHEFGHVFASLARLQRAFLLGLLGDDRLFSFEALSRAGNDGAGAGSADFNGNLGAGGLGRVLGDSLLVDGAPLDRPV